jgi:hypothetical protein
MTVLSIVPRYFTKNRPRRKDDLNFPRDYGTNLEFRD